MTDHRLPRLLLGPQRPTRNLDRAVESLDLADGPIAVISAGWQEAEGDIDDVEELVGRPLADLHLYRRAETLLQGDERLRDAYRARQDQLMEPQRLYRLRLKQLAVAARQVLAADGDTEMLAAEQRHAIAQLRALDRHHLHRTEAIQRRFDDQFNAEVNAGIASQVRELRSILADCAAVLITGGNIIVLLNRMRLFAIASELRDKPVIAWSAGAMALTERVVLFHDRTPQGRRDPEILGAGCGLVPGFVFLPDVQRRLRAGDRRRVGLFCRRFSPDTCVVLDSGSALTLAGSDIGDAVSVRRLNHDGSIARIRAA